MKNKILMVISIIVITLGAIIIIKSTPKQYTLTFEGIKYQLGAENNHFSNPVTLRIDGKLKKGLTGLRTFKGTIEIDGEIIPVPEDERELEIKFQEDGVGHIRYGYYNNGNPGTFAQGMIFINKDFSEITIATFEKDGEDPSRRIWTSEDGFMITAPAENRAEALTISNELMKKHLRGNSLK